MSFRFPDPRPRLVARAFLRDEGKVAIGARCSVPASLTQKRPNLSLTVTVVGQYSSANDLSLLTM